MRLCFSWDPVAERRSSEAAQAPWHFLYFFPLPHGHGSLRPTLSHTTRCCTATGPVLVVPPPAATLGGGASAKPSSAGAPYSPAASAAPVNEVCVMRSSPLV